MKRLPRCRRTGRPTRRSSERRCFPGAILERGPRPDADAPVDAAEITRPHTGPGVDGDGWPATRVSRTCSPSEECQRRHQVGLDEAIPSIPVATAGQQIKERHAARVSPYPRCGVHDPQHAICGPGQVVDSNQLTHAGRIDRRTRARSSTIFAHLDEADPSRHDGELH